MFKINDLLFNKKLREKVVLIGVSYDCESKRMLYLTERKNEEIVESDFYDLMDVRYL